LQEELFNLNLPENLLNLRSKIRKNLESAVLETEIEKKKTLLTFSIIGANPRGIEIACSVSDYVGSLLKNKFTEINKSLIRVNLFEQRNAIGRDGESLFNNYLFYALNKKEIKIYTGAKVTQVTKGRLVINNKEQVSAGMTILSFKNKHSSLLNLLSLPKDDEHNILVDLFAKVQGLENIFVVGEGSKCIDLQDKLQKSIQFLNDEAKTVAYNIVAKINNNPLRSLKTNQGFVDVFCGRKQHIIKIRKYYLGGFLGWIIGRIIYFFYFVGLKKKIKVFFSSFITLLGLNDDILYDILETGPMKVNMSNKTKKDLLTKV